MKNDVILLSLYSCHSHCSMFHKMPCFGVIKRNQLVEIFWKWTSSRRFFSASYWAPCSSHSSITDVVFVGCSSYESGTDRGGQRLFKKIMAQNVTWFCITVNSSLIFSYIFLQLYQVFIFWIVQHLVTTGLWNFTLLMKCKQVFFFSYCLCNHPFKCNF